MCGTNLFTRAVDRQLSWFPCIKRIMKSTQQLPYYYQSSLPPARKPTRPPARPANSPSFRFPAHHRPARGAPLDGVSTRLPVYQSRHMAKQSTYLRSPLQLDASQRAAPIVARCRLSIKARMIATFDFISSRQSIYR